jgi:ABC-2 type transport system permease protein
MTIATLSCLLFAAPLNFAAGNLFSIYSPKRVDYGIFGRQKAPQLTILASFGVQLFILGSGAITILLARSYGSLWLAVPIFLLLAVPTFAAYFLVLARVDGIALARRETIVSELGKA